MSFIDYKNILSCRHSCCTESIRRPGNKGDSSKSDDIYKVAWAEQLFAIRGKSFLSGRAGGTQENTSLPKLLTPSLEEALGKIGELRGVRVTGK